MPKLYALTHVLLVHLKDDSLFRITIPSKVLDYMAAGKPILAAVAGDAADVVTEAGAGIACPPGDPQAVASAVRRFRSMGEGERCRMGERGFMTIHRQYTREVVVGEIEAVLQGVARK